MSLNITSYPQKVVDNDNNKISRWSAVHHAIKFGMKREDYDIRHYYNATTFVSTIVITNGTVIDNFVAGDKIFVETPTGSVELTVASYSSPNIIYSEPLALSYNPSLYGYMNVLSRTNYFIRTLIWGVNLANQYYYIGTSINKVDASGNAIIDVSAFLKQAVGYENEFDYDAINEKDLSLGGQYNITFNENWVGYEGEYAAVSANNLRFYVNAAKQIQDEYGSNMGAYVPFYLAASPEVDDNALFLSDFEKPTYFPDYPFDLQFIYSESLAGIITTREEETFNVNGVSQSTSSTELNNSQIQEVNRLMIAQSYAAGITEIDVWLNSEGTVDCDKYVLQDYVLSNYVQEICGTPIIIGNPVEAGDLTSQAQQSSAVDAPLTQPT